MYCSTADLGKLSNDAAVGATKAFVSRHGDHHGCMDAFVEVLPLSRSPTMLGRVTSMLECVCDELLQDTSPVRSIPSTPWPLLSRHAADLIWEDLNVATPTTTRAGGSAPSARRGDD